MKKLLCIVVCAAVGSAIFAQNYEAYNKFGSDGVFMTRGDEQGFGGLYNEVSGLVDFNMFSVQAECRLALGDGFEQYRLYGTVEKANIWFRPVAGLEFVVGNEFYQTLPGAYMMVLDEFVSGGRYGSEKFGVTFAYAPVTIGMNIPEVNLGDDFSAKVNLGVNFAAADGLNVGVAYRMDHDSIGVFANYSGMDGFYVGGGYTYNGEPLFHNKVEGNHLLDFTIMCSFWRLALEGDLEFVLGDEAQTPFYAGLAFIWNITECVSFKTDFMWDMLLRESDVLNDSWNLTVHPRFVLSAGRHQLICGVQFCVSEEPTTNDYANTVTNISVPVSWKYTF